MSIAQPKPMTREQFLAWETKQELRYEIDGFQPVAMTSGTVAHAVIQHNLHGSRRTPRRWAVSLLRQRSEDQKPSTA
jgi:hypothetical protein